MSLVFSHPWDDLEASPHRVTGEEEKSFYISLCEFVFSSSPSGTSAHVDLVDKEKNNCTTLEDSVHVAGYRTLTGTASIKGPHQSSSCPIIFIGDTLRRK